MVFVVFERKWTVELHSVTVCKCIHGSTINIILDFIRSCTDITVDFSVCVCVFAACLLTSSVMAFDVSGDELSSFVSCVSTCTEPTLN